MGTRASREDLPDRPLPVSPLPEEPYEPLPEKSQSLLLWDMGTKYPIIDGKTLDPVTKEVIPYSGKSWYHGPPTVVIRWHNVRAASPGEKQPFIQIVGEVPYASLNEVMLDVMRHVAAGLYSLFGLAATEFSVIVTCSSKLTGDEFIEETGRLDEAQKGRGIKGDKTLVGE